MSEGVVNIAKTGVNESSQLNLDKNSFITPSYRFLRMYQQSGGTNVTISTAGGETSIFEIPPRVFNFARSYLSFQITFPAFGAAGNYNIAFKDCLSMIQKIEVYTQNGVKLDEIQYVAEYTKLIWKPETPYEEYRTFPIFKGGENMGQMLCASNESKDNVAAQISVIRPSSTTTDNAFSSYISYVEPQYVESGGNNTNTPVWYIRIPFRMLYYTLLSLDKDIYFPSTIYIRITWNSSTKMYYTSTAALSVNANTSAATKAVTMSNLYLFLAVEENEKAITYIKNAVNSGKYEVLFPHTIGSKLNTGSVAQNSTISVKYSGVDGLSLCKLFWAYMKNANTTKSTYETSLINGNSTTIFNAKVRKFHTELDGKYIQDYDLDVSKFEPYLFQKDRLEGSIIMGVNVYYYNFVWIDSFMSTLPYHKEKDIIFNNIVGVPLTTDKKYDIVVSDQNSAQYNVFVYAVTQRMLSISPLAVQVV